MACSSQVGWQSLLSTPDFRSRQSIPLLKVQNVKNTKLYEQNFKIGSIKSRSLIAHCDSMVNGDVVTGSFSPSNTIGKLYSSINNKDLSQLALLISEDCFFGDFSFPQSFQGKKEALKSLEQLTTSMGQNTEFRIDNIYESVDLTAIVNWHLEWKKKEVPFSRGCSYYELSRDGEKLLIKNAQVITESSMTPKILALFNRVTSVSGYIGDGATRFLKNRHSAYQVLLNSYKFVVQPFISPVITVSSMTPKFLALFNMATSVSGYIGDGATRFLKNRQSAYQVLLNSYKFVVQPFISPVITVSSMTLALFNMATSVSGYIGDGATRFLKNRQSAYQVLLNSYKFVVQPFISPVITVSSMTLALFNMATSVSGYIGDAATGFLKNRQFAYQVLLNSYKFVVQPFISPVIIVSSMTLALFNMATSVSGYIGDAATRFLKNYQVAYQLLKSYKLVVQPFISSILAWFKKLWTLALTFLGFTIKLVQFIIKYFRQ